VAEFLQESIIFLERVQCRRNESSRSLSHLLMSFLPYHYFNYIRHVAMSQKFAGVVVGAPLRTNMLNMPKSASVSNTCF